MPVNSKLICKELFVHIHRIFKIICYFHTRLSTIFILLGAMNLSPNREYSLCTITNQNSAERKTYKDHVPAKEDIL